jgi:NADH:ubiquinone oxidoreductase subunit 2 (subunit N)
LHLNEITVQANKGKMAVLLIGLLRLGGSPPFLGFYAKILVIQVVLGHAQVLIVMILVASSVFLLYVYVRLFYYMRTGTAIEMQVGSPDFLYRALIRPRVVILLLLPWL